MKTKFVKGPWVLSDINKKGYRHISGGGWHRFGKVCVRMDGETISDEQGEANARLIQEAPIMFEALLKIKGNFLCKSEVDAQIGEEIWDVLDRVAGEKNDY